MNPSSKSESSIVAYNALIQIFGRLIFLALSFINIKLITNYLEPNIFGEYSTILTFSGFFTVLIDLGLFTVAVREISKDKNRAQEIMSNVLALRIITAILATTIVVILGFSLPQYSSLGTNIFIAALAMLAYFLSNILDVVFHVNLKMKYISYSEIISKVSILIFVIVAIQWNYGLVGIILAILLGSLVAILPRIYWAKKFIKIKLAYDKKVWRWLLSLALPLGLVFILNNIYFKIDSQMLYLMSTTYDAGLYGLAYRILETTLFVAAFITAAITPTLSRTISSDKETASNLVSRALEALLAAALILFVTIFVFSSQIVLLLSDSSYLAASQAVQILAGAAALIYINSLFGQILIAADRRKTLIGFSLFLVIFNIVLNYFLIPIYGFIGAAWATVISEFAILLFNLLVVIKIIPLKLEIRRIAYIIISTLVLTTVYLLLKNQLSWLLTIALGLLIYLTIIWQAKFLSWQMIKEIASIDR